MKKLLITLLLSSFTGVGCVFIGFNYSKDPFFQGFIIIGICIFLGVAIKIMDLLIDDIRIRWIGLIVNFEGVSCPVNSDAILDQSIHKLGRS